MVLLYLDPKAVGDKTSNMALLGQVFLLKTLNVANIVPKNVQF